MEIKRYPPGEYVVPQLVGSLEPAAERTVSFAQSIKLEEITSRISDSNITSRLIMSLDFTTSRTMYFSEYLRERFLISRKEEELQKLVAVSHSIETDPERLRRLREAAGEPHYSCYLIWLVNKPYDALPEEYKAVELELYKLARYNADIHLSILDSTRYPAVVADLMRALELDSLPALVMSTKPIDLKRPLKENTITFSHAALRRLAEQNKVALIVANVPVWARTGILADKAKWEGQIKTLLADLWDQIKGLVSINIS